MKSQWIASILVCVVATLTAATCADDKGDKIAVRNVEFTPKDDKADKALIIWLGISGQSKVTTLTDAAAIEKLVGTDNVKGQLSKVDFNKDQLVCVSWMSSGPPYGTLKHEVKGVGKDRQVTFYVQGSGRVKAKKGNSSVELVIDFIGADFFALPRNVKVAFDPKER